MNKEEKELLLQLVLEDIRGNWAESLLERTNYALKLTTELYKQTKDKNWSIMKKSILGFLKEIEDGYPDGRYFRIKFPNGYENMDYIHGLSKTFLDKSNEFKILAQEYLTYPEYRFKDWDIA